jgi:hypothetical protein
VCSDPSLSSVAKTKCMSLPPLVYICLYDLLLKHRNYFTSVCCMLNFPLHRLNCAFKFGKITFMNEENVINTSRLDSNTLFAEEITTQYVCIESHNIYGIEFCVFCHVYGIRHQIHQRWGVGDVKGGSRPT